MFRKTLRGILPISLAVIVAVLLPFSSLAETASVDSNTATDATTQATAPNAQGGNGMENNSSQGGKGMGNAPAQAGNAPAMTNYTVDTSNLTDEQNTIYTQAVTLYEQVEDEVLSDLVTAGVVAQADVDTYTALRAAQKTLTDIDKTAWGELRAVRPREYSTVGKDSTSVAASTPRCSRFTDRICISSVSKT